MKPQYNFHKGDNLPRKQRGSKLPLNPAQYKRLRKLIRGSDEKLKFRNLLLVNFQINSSLRASDVLKLTVGDVYRSGRYLDKIWVTQKKTDSVVAVPILDVMVKDLELARGSYHDLLSDDYFDEKDHPLFPSWKRISGGFKAISYPAYLMMLKGWIEDIGLNPDLYGTHSLRSSLPLEYYRKTRDETGTSKLFGHRNKQTTVAYIEEVASDIASDFRKEFFFDG